MNLFADTLLKRWRHSVCLLLTSTSSLDWQRRCQHCATSMWLLWHLRTHSPCSTRWSQAFVTRALGSMLLKWHGSPSMW